MDLIYKKYNTPINLYLDLWQKRLDPIFEKYDLIFLDNLSTLAFQIEDGAENSSSTWSIIGDWLRNWKRKGKTIVLVHHANKSGGSARGSSMISVEMMTLIRMSPIDTKDENIDINSKVFFEKHREISGKWKLPFQIKLEQNVWKINN